MTNVLRTMIQELRYIAADKGVLLIFVAGLIIYTSFYPLPYAREVLKDNPVIPVDQDNTQMSRKLMHWVEATEEVRFVHPTSDLGEAKELVLHGDAQGIFVIPEHFERDILLGKQAVVSGYADCVSFLIYRQIMTGIYKASATLSAGVEIRRLTAAGHGEKDAMRVREPLPVDTRPLFNPASGYATYVVPGVLILILQQTLLMGIGMLGGARNERVLASGMAEHKGSCFSVLLGRGLAYFSVYIWYPLFYVAIIFHAFRFPSQGNPGVLLLFFVPYVLSVTFLGLMFTTFFRARETSIPALLYTSLPGVFMIGFVWPLEAIPRGLRMVSYLLPSTTGSAGFLRLNQMGASLYQVRYEWYTLWVLCALYFVLGWIGMVWQHRHISTPPTEVSE